MANYMYYSKPLNGINLLSIWPRKVIFGRILIQSTWKIISRLYCAVSTPQCLYTLYITHCKSHSMDCKSMLLVTKPTLYLRGLSNSFSNSFIGFYSCEVVSSCGTRKKEVLSFDHFASIMAIVWNFEITVSSCVIFPFCDVLHATKQKRKQQLLRVHNTYWKSFLLEHVRQSASMYDQS